MKPQTWCLSVFIVAILLVADIPRVHGWFIPAENGLLNFVRTVTDSMNNILQGGFTSEHETGTTESESGCNCDESKETDYYAGENGSEGGDSSWDTKKSSENRWSTVINLENFLKPLTTYLKGCM